MNVLSALSPVALVGSVLGWGLGEFKSSSTGLAVLEYFLNNEWHDRALVHKSKLDGSRRSLRSNRLTSLCTDYRLLHRLHHRVSAQRSAEELQGVPQFASHLKSFSTNRQEKGDQYRATLTYPRFLNSREKDAHRESRSSHMQPAYRGRGYGTYRCTEPIVRYSHRN